MSYKLRCGAGGVKAETVAHELKRINDKHGGITPRAVVDEAEPIESPLHPAFTWNDQKAADLYRLTEARGLIRAVHVVDDNTGDDLGCEFVRVTTTGEDEESTEGVYMPRAEVVANPDLFASAVRGLMSHLKSAEKALSDLEGQAAKTKSKPRVRAVKQASQAVRTAHDALAEAL